MPRKTLTEQLRTANLRISDLETENDELIELTERDTEYLEALSRSESSLLESIIPLLEEKKERVIQTLHNDYNSSYDQPIMVRRVEQLKSDIEFFEIEIKKKALEALNRAVSEIEG